MMSGAAIKLWSQWNPKADTVVSGILISVAFFLFLLLAGFAGMMAGMTSRKKKYKIDIRVAGKRLIAVLLTLALLVSIGQLLYCVEKQKYTEEIVIDDSLKGLHLAVLMDISGSMDNEQEACVEAACQLIDGLSESDSMQFIAFAATVPERGESEFLPMTSANKAVLKDMVRSVDMMGGTNFNEPLDKAITTLQNNQDSEYSSVIMMITDGEDSVDDRIRNVLADPNGDIALFTLRITDTSVVSDPDVQNLIDMAEMDFPIVPQADGTVDVTAIQDAFQAAVNYQRVIVEEHEKLGMGSDLIFDTADDSLWWRPVIQIVVFALYALLISIAYYGKTGVVSVVLSLATGAATGWVITHSAMWYIILLTVCLTAFTILETEEVPEHV